jgi:peroxiredoxin family protein
MAKHENDDVYTRNGYKDREDYLKNLADDQGVELVAVNMLADLLGPSEDFDGLASGLEDMGFIGALDAFRE